MKDYKEDPIVIRIGYDSSYCCSPLIFDSINEYNVKIDFSETTFGGYHYLSVSSIKEDSLEMANYFIKGFNLGSRKTKLRFNEKAKHLLIIKPKLIYRREESMFYMDATASVANLDVYLIKEKDTLFKVFMDPIFANGSPFFYNQKKEFQKLIKQSGRGIRAIKRRLKKENKRLEKKQIKPH